MPSDRCAEKRAPSGRSLSSRANAPSGDRLGDHAIAEIGAGCTIGFAQARARVIAKLSDPQSSWLVAPAA
jgi:hypothetical protein